MPKPKGGRGKAAPYFTRQVRVPEPLISQVDKLIESYQDYISEGGNPISPPDLCNYKAANNFNNEEKKLVDNFIKHHILIISLLKNALKLKANSGGAIKEEIRRVFGLLFS